MPQHTTITIPPRTWTMVTTTAVTSVRIQNMGPYMVLVQATSDTAGPSADDAGSGGEFRLAPGSGWAADRDISDIFPGVVDAAYLWVWSDAGARISISHA